MVPYTLAYMIQNPITESLSAYSTGPMVPSTWANITTARLPVSVVLSYPMVTSTKAIGRMTKPMVSVSTFTRMALSMKDNGRMISNRGMAKKSGRIWALTKGCIETAIKMAKGYSFGQMEPLTKGTGKIIRCMVEACLSGKTAEHMRVNGPMTGKKVMESSDTQMAE